MKYEVIEKKKSFIIRFHDSTLDFYNTEELKKVFDNILYEKNKDIKLDLSEIKTIDSRIVSLLLVFHKKIKEANHSMEIEKISDEVRSIFEVMNVDEIFHLNKKS